MLVLLSCSSELEVKQPAYQAKIVVDGWMESNQLARIYLTQSSAFLTDYDSASIRESILTRAKVSILNSKGENEILTLYKDENYFPPYVYKTIVMRGEVGISYDLKVEIMGQVLTSSTRIPDKPSIQKCIFVNRTDSSGIINLSLKADPTKDSYLFFQSKSFKGDRGFHPCYPKVLKLETGSDAGLIDIYRNVEFNLVSNVIQGKAPSFYDNYPPLEFSVYDTVLIKAGTIDLASFEVLRSIFEDQGNRYNPIAFNGNEIKTNINGGIGHWTGVGLAPTQAIFRYP